MPKTTKKIKPVKMTLNDLLTMKLKTLYDVEHQLIKALPKMAKKSSDADLRIGFERHAKQTEEHANRLERAFDALGVRAQELKCEAIRGLIVDAEGAMKNIKGDAALDAGLVAAAQCVEHYEMAEYGSAVTWAKLLDESEIADLLQETLDEEAETSDELTELANSKIDEKAMGGETEADGEEEDEENEEP